MDRLYGFQTTVAEAGNLQGVTIQPGKSYLELINLNVSLPDKQPLLKDININLQSGDRLLVRGRSGSGKTTFLRSIAGLWPFTSGEIKQIPELTSLFIAQRPYLPYGSLRNAICYPKTNELPESKIIIDLLKQFSMPALTDQLDEIADWGNKLSLGEQQRVAFCRILINKPDIIYLDEATSALDEETEEQMYRTLTEALPKSAIISVAHRSTIKQWHNKHLNFNILS